MYPPSARIPEDSAVTPLWFFVLILLRRPMIMLAGYPHTGSLGPGVFLPRLFWRLDPHFLGEILGNFCPSDWYFFGHWNSWS
jgi:hypothetical protein